MRIDRAWALLALLALVGLASCDSGSADAEQAGKRETSWELPDDSTVLVTARPWPPRSGPVKIRAKVTTGDWSEDLFDGTISFRAGKSSPWKTMRRVGVEDEYLVLFESDDVLASGKVALQFKVESSLFEEPIELLDWTVNVR